MLIEIVTFRLADGSTEAEFLAADAALQADLSSRPGFVRRTTARGADDTWLVLSLWWDADHADATGAALPTAVDLGSIRTERFVTLD